MATFTLFDLSRWRQAILQSPGWQRFKQLGLARQAAGLGLLLALLVALAGLLCIHLSAQQGRNQLLQQWAAEQVQLREAALVTAVGSEVNEAITSRMQYFLEVGLAQGARLQQSSSLRQWQVGAMPEAVTPWYLLWGGSVIWC